jgi:two-component system, OmpR family, copper resistance phosphate regulon response regulator CusR
VLQADVYPDTLFPHVSSWRIQPPLEARFRAAIGGYVKVLVIEDERKAASYLKKGLSEHGYVVDISYDGEAGRQLATQFPYDLLIIDILLPQRDGWSVLRELRNSGCKTPALFLSALSGVEDKVRGLRLGADDYIVKPFAFSELLARIESILRRGPAHPQDVLRVADLEIQVLRHKANRSGCNLDLTLKEFQLLSLLARRPGDVFSRTVIAEQVWDMNFDSDTNLVEVHIRRLRSKVDDPFKTRLIHTVRGLGYVLEERAAEAAST